MLTGAAIVTLISGFAACGLYGPRAWDLWADSLDTPDERQRFAASMVVIVSGAYAVVTAINSFVR